jgi:hypothetical protein
VVMLKDVAQLMRNHIIHQRHWSHDQTPIEPNASARVAATPSLRLVDDA